jgi:hypothetical protein
MIELYNCNGGTCIVLLTWDGSNTMHVSPLQFRTKVLTKAIMTIVHLKTRSPHKAIQGVMLKMV